MTLKALIDKNNMVVQVCDMSQCFPVHPDLKWVTANDDTVFGDSYINGLFVKPVVPTIHYTKQRINAYDAAGLSISDYIDEMRKERLGLPNNLESMDAKALEIKNSIPKS